MAHRHNGVSTHSVNGTRMRQTDGQTDRWHVTHKWPNGKKTPSVLGLLSFQ